MRRKCIAVGVFVLICGFLLWWFSASQVVQRKTEGFLEVMSLGRGVGSGGRHLKVYKLNGLLAKSIDIKAPFLGDDKRSVMRDDIESAYSWLCDTAVETKFEMDEVESISIDGDQAILQCLITALAEMPKVRSLDGQYRVIFTWNMIEDQWRLSSMNWEEAP